MITLTEILIFFFYSDKSIPVLKINAERNFEFNFQQTNSNLSNACNLFSWSW